MQLGHVGWRLQLRRKVGGSTPAFPGHMSKHPWARHWTPRCLPSVGVWTSRKALSYRLRRAVWVGLNVARSVEALWVLVWVRLEKRFTSTVPLSFTNELFTFKTFPRNSLQFAVAWTHGHQRSSFLLGCFARPFSAALFSRCSFLGPSAFTFALKGFFWLF